MRRPRTCRPPRPATINRARAGVGFGGGGGRGRGGADASVNWSAGKASQRGRESVWGAMWVSAPGACAAHGGPLLGCCRLVGGGGARALAGCACAPNTRPAPTHMEPGLGHPLPSVRARRGFSPCSPAWTAPGPARRRPPLPPPPYTAHAQPHGCTRARTHLGCSTTPNHCRASASASSTLASTAGPMWRSLCSSSLLACGRCGCACVRVHMCAHGRARHRRWGGPAWHTTWGGGGGGGARPTKSWILDQLAGRNSGSSPPPRPRQQHRRNDDDDAPRQAGGS